MNQRHIPLQGGYNFRDLGGYPTLDGRQTRRGLIYRSGALSQLTDSDRAILKKLDIRTVFDLREAYEHANEGEDKPGEGVQVIHLPTSIGRQAIRQQLATDPRAFRMVNFYLSSLPERIEYHAELFKQVVSHLDHPLVIHCSAGKDRTGIVAALLLRLARVDDALIIADYAETDQHLAEYSAQWRSIFQGFGMPDFVIDEMLACPPETMARTLDYLDEQFGSAEEYLLRGGVTSEQIEQFKRAFVE